MKHYTYILNRGEMCFHRYIENGKDVIEKFQLNPYYFIKTQEETGYKDIYGNNVSKIDFSNVKAYRDNRKLLVDSGIEVLGMDNLELLSISDLYPSEIEFDPSKIRIASIDIETVSKYGFPYPNEAIQEIDAITHIDSITRKIYLLSTRKWDDVKSTLDKNVLSRVVYRYFPSEKEMLLDYLSLWKQNYPHIVTGWNIDRYDIQYLVNRYNRLFGENVTKGFSPFGIISSRLAEDESETSESPEMRYTFEGIASLDYMLLYKKFRLINRPSYKLDSIAEIELKEKKLDYSGPLWQLAEENPQRYCDYNIQDTLLIEKLESKMKYISLAISLSYYSKINFEKVYSAVTTWDSIIYNSLRKDNIIVPMKKKMSKDAPYIGAYVKEPKLGKRYGWIASFDATSLYPSIIRQWNISPETIMGQDTRFTIEDYLYKRAEISKEYGQAANGSLYDNSKRGVVPSEIEKVFFQRKHHKSNDFFIKKVGEVYKLCITLYNKLPKDLELDSFKYVGKSELEIQNIVNSYDEKRKDEEYILLENDLKILHSYIEK